MMFEYDRRSERWSVSHDQGETWSDVPPDGPSKYMRWYERRRLPRKTMEEVEKDL